MSRFEGELCDTFSSEAKRGSRPATELPDHAFVCPFTGEEHVALVKGNVAEKSDVLVRLHSECVTGDVFRFRAVRLRQQLDAAMKRLGRAPQGVLCTWPRRDAASGS